MITDRELDARLDAAAGMHDADLPALPEGFLRELTSTGSEPASVVAARQLVSDARERRSTPRRRPGRKAFVRAGIAVVAVAAAWTTAVLVTPADRPTPPVATPGPTSEAPVDGIQLVAAEEVTFPLTLDPAPPGLTPTFSMVGGVGFFGDLPLVHTADYTGDSGRVLVRLFAEDPRGPEDTGYGLDEAPAGSATVGGRPAEVRQGDGYVSLLWELPDDRWVQVLGEGDYGPLAALLPVAESVVDRPQPLGLQFGLAPAGWTLTGYEESRQLDLTRNGDAEQLLRVSVYPGGTATLDEIVDAGDLTAPPTPVTIQGREGRLALAEGGASPDFWRAAGQLPDGYRFLMLAPQALTQDQVLQIAEQITYTP
ncbi:hypothetical protein [Blastococcus sp. LR1]|uniref:hypothetical protein n=1 Tax=Blastococcus sp. LR1 TaxID=2877000 RepID=UPI001CCD3B56|nr:hypothetical protein [Blastococcus sp. LR1]MCA0145897.1 hypothetical protein [Blastococcus sp. LR1]